MKLSNLTAKLTCMKSSAVRVLAAATLAGAVLAAAPAAQAQRVFVGVHVGPRYVAPAPVVVYGSPEYYGAPVYAPGPAVYGSFGLRDHDRRDWGRDRDWHDRGFARPLDRRDDHRR